MEQENKCIAFGLLDLPVIQSSIRKVHGLNISTF